LAFVIPQDNVSEIRNGVDIVEIVSETVSLKKAGQNYQGLCPFHVEKTPSFTVSPSKQIFHCFGCGEGGDVFRYLMKKEGLSFPEALQVLARRGGVALPTQDLSLEEKQRIHERENLLSLNRLVMAYFREQLQEPLGKKARAYLEKRGVSKEVIDQFQLGVAPDGWEGLTRYLSRKNVPMSLGVKAGLLKARNEQNGYYDVFRDRVIFPIADSGNRIIGFGGRVMDDTLPKYLNSSESLIFNKRRSLYGIRAARDECRAKGEVFVVEGYFDLLALHQNEIRNSVATLGTALTPDHIQVLKGLIGAAGHVVLVFDSDAAGIKAAERSIDLFSKGYVDARILVLPEGHDPDSFLLEFGGDEFRKGASGALPIVPFLIEAAIRRHGVSTDGKVRIVNELIGTLAAVEDGMARSLHIRDLAERIGVDQTAVLEKVKDHLSTGGSQIKFPRLPVNGTSPQTRENEPIQQRNRLECQLISMMLQFPEILPEFQNRNLLQSFEDSLLRGIGETALVYVANIKEIKAVVAGDVIGRLETDEAKKLATELAIKNELWDYKGCVKVMNQFIERTHKKRKNQLVLQIRAAEKTGNQEDVDRLIRVHRDATKR
jgi:DNA primase